MWEAQARFSGDPWPPWSLGAVGSVDSFVATAVVTAQAGALGEGDSGDLEVCTCLGRNQKGRGERQPLAFLFICCLCVCVSLVLGQCPSSLDVPAACEMCPVRAAAATPSRSDSHSRSCAKPFCWPLPGPQGPRGSRGASPWRAPYGACVSM